MQPPPTSKLLLHCSVIVYMLSLTQIGFYTSDAPSDGGLGIFLLISGALGFFLSPAGFMWTANLALFIAWGALSSQPKTSLLSNIVAIALGISFLFFDKIVSDEAGNYHNIVRYGAGYCLWLSSPIILLVAQLFLFIKRLG